MDDGVGVAKVTSYINYNDSVNEELLFYVQRVELSKIIFWLFCLSLMWITTLRKTFHIRVRQKLLPLGNTD